MQYKLSKNEWLSIGKKAGWLKTADIITHETGSEGFGAAEYSEREGSGASWTFSNESASPQMKTWILWNVNEKAREERSNSGDTSNKQYREGDIDSISGEISTSTKSKHTFIPGGTRKGMDMGRLDAAPDEHVESVHRSEETASSGAINIEVRMKDGSTYSIIKHGKGRAGDFGRASKEETFDKIVSGDGYFKIEQTSPPMEGSSSGEDKRSIWQRIFGRKASAEDFQKVMGWTPKN